MIVLALDPGGTTGYAYGQVVQDLFRFRGAGQSKLGGDRLYGMLESIDPAIVIAERFDSREGIAKVELVSRNLLGVLELWAEIRNVDVTYQSASEGFGFYANAKLQKMGVWIPGNVHANDASRHLLHWATFKAGSRWLGPGTHPVIEFT